jgi:SAM-dependent methyltransferase
VSESPEAGAGWVTNLTWSDGVVAVRCAVCGQSDGQTLLATAEVAWRDAPVEIARCSRCGAVVLSAVRPPTEYFDEALWDRYLESTAGLGIIAELLARAGRGQGSTMLDVGCGYGFALDLGAFLFGWRGIGLDPSVAATRGRAELGLDIRPGYLDTAFETDEVFDVVFCSEVLEHVPDPVDFTAKLAARLSADGVLLLTTPSAGIVHPDTDLTVLLSALSIGAHVFLLEDTGLTQLLRDAGLEAVVWRDGPSLRAVAARTPEALAAVPAVPDFGYGDLARYCDARADTAEPGSALQAGMVARHLEYSVNLGDLEGAKAAWPRLRSALLARFGVDVENPKGEVPFAACSVMAGVFYFAGMFTLNSGGNARDAAHYFEASARAAHVVSAQPGMCREPAVAALEFVALAHRAVALTTASASRRSVERALGDLDDAVRRGLGDASAAAAYRERTEQVREDLKAANDGHVGLRARLRR